MQSLQRPTKSGCCFPELEFAGKDDSGFCHMNCTRTCVAHRPLRRPDQRAASIAFAPTSPYVVDDARVHISATCEIISFLPEVHASCYSSSLITVVHFDCNNYIASHSTDRRNASDMYVLGTRDHLPSFVW